MKTIFSKGDKVAVINCTLGGRFFVESKSAVVMEYQGDNAYCVRMGTGLFDRFIDPNAQADPEAFVAKLNQRAQQ